MALSNQQLLDSVEAAISAVLDGGVVAYQINGRGATLLDLAELMRQRDKLLAAVQREGPAGGSFAVGLFRSQR